MEHALFMTLVIVLNFACWIHSREWLNMLAIGFFLGGYTAIIISKFVST